MQLQESDSETRDENFTENRKRTLDNFNRKIALGTSASSSESGIKSEYEKVSENDKKPDLKDVPTFHLDSLLGQGEFTRGQREV